MKRSLHLLIILLMSLHGFAQVPDTKELHEKAKAHMKQGDYANAVLVLNRCLQEEPKNLEIAKDLAQSYYFQNDNSKALDVIKPLLERDDTDDQCYRITANIYKALALRDDCEKTYKKGLKKFPASGALYNDLGELMQSQANYESIKYWEKGIEADPSFPGNYYNAAKFYYLTTDKVWGILYGEIYLNLEPFSSRAPEMKELLVESYKKLFSNADLELNYKEKNNFVKTYLQCMNKQSSLAAMSINAETLTMIRTRFILDWNNHTGVKYAFHLFDYHRQLLQDGLFDAYNQWLFGSVQNLAGFQNWINTHNTEYADFTNFQKSRVVHIPQSQYYH